MPRDTRKKLHCSRAVFARKLRVNVRTLEKWEQRRAKPNPQAAALVLLVRKYPDTLARLDALAAGCGIKGISVNSYACPSWADPSVIITGAKGPYLVTAHSCFKTSRASVITPST